MINKLVTGSVSKEDLVNLRNRFSSIAENDIIVLEITPLNARMFKGDFLGLLAFLDIPPNLWAMTLELNHIENTIDYNGDQLKIKALRR